MHDCLRCRRPVTGTSRQARPLGCSSTSLPTVAPCHRGPLSRALTRREVHGGGGTEQGQEGDSGLHCQRYRHRLQLCHLREAKSALCSRRQTKLSSPLKAFTDPGGQLSDLIFLRHISCDRYRPSLSPWPLGSYIFYDPSLVRRLILPTYEKFRLVTVTRREKRCHPGPFYSSSVRRSVRPNDLPFASHCGRYLVARRLASCHRRYRSRTNHPPTTRPSWLRRRTTARAAPTTTAFLTMPKHTTPPRSDTPIASAPGLGHTRRWAARHQALHPSSG